MNRKPPHADAAPFGSLPAPSRRAFGLSGVAALLGAGCPTVFGQGTYPDRVIRLVVGFPAGGQSDIVARMVAEAMGKQLKQTVIVENKAGASGIIGAEMVAHAKPDGYTLMLTSEAVQSRATAVFKRVPYDPVNDFTLLAKVAKQKALMVVNANSPFRTAADFIANARKNPGKINYGATHGTTSQFAAALFSLQHGLDMVAVNYPGGAQPITDLLGGVVDVGFFIESTVAQHVQAGKLRALAVIADEPGELIPEAPTALQATGKALDTSPWFGVVGPAKLPADIVGVVTEALARAAADPAYQQQMKRIGAVPIVGSTPGKFTAEVKSEVEHWKRFVKDTKYPVME